MNTMDKMKLLYECLLFLLFIGGGTMCVHHLTDQTPSNIIIQDKSLIDKNNSTIISKSRQQGDKSQVWEYNQFYNHQDNSTSKNDDQALLNQDLIKVDLRCQMLYIYRKSELVFSTAIVSGHPKTPTPIGQYRILNKESPKILSGINPLSKQKYHIPVNNWLVFDESGIGFHDAEWLTNFGGDIYQHYGSLGCISVSPGHMQKLYDLVDVGMPVLVVN